MLRARPAVLALLALLCERAWCRSGGGELQLPLCDREWNPEEMHASIDNRSLLLSCEGWTKGQCLAYGFRAPYTPSAAEQRQLRVFEGSAHCARTDFSTAKSVPRLLNAVVSQRRFVTQVSKVWCVHGRHVRTLTDIRHIPVLGNATFVVDHVLRAHAADIHVEFEYDVALPWFLLPFASWMAEFFAAEVRRATQFWARAVCSDGAQ